MRTPGDFSSSATTRAPVTGASVSDSSPAVMQERQPFVIEAQLMQERGVQVRNADAIHRRLVAELVGLAVRQAAAGSRRRPGTG